jgi:hypothetical protein
MRIFGIVLFAVMGLTVRVASGADAIAANETAAAAACKAFCEAEEIYHRTDYDRDGILEYSQSIRGGKAKIAPKKVDAANLPQPSDEERKKIDALIKQLGNDEFKDREVASKELLALGGKVMEQMDAVAKENKDPEVGMRIKDIKSAIFPPEVNPKNLECGLVYFLQNGIEQELGLLDKAMGDAECPANDDIPNAKPKAGYLFRVLTKQGKAATGGARSYLVGDNMTLGYALLAFPKEYGVTGKNVFIINNNGIIFQKDVGSKEKLDELLKTHTEFNPDTSWAATE